MLSQTTNQLYDTNYTDIIKQWWAPFVDRSKIKRPDKKGWFDRIVDYFVYVRKKDPATLQETKHALLEDSSLDQQLKAILETPDADYKDSLLSSELRKYILELEKEYVSVIKDYAQHIAPSYWEASSSQFQVGNMVARTYYANSYPSYIDFLWTRDIMSYYGKWEMTWFIYPADESAIQSVLKRRSTQLRAQISTDTGKWRTYDAEVDVEQRDVENIRQKLATREERYFEAGFYATLYQHDEEKLREDSKKFEQKIGGYGIRMKPATYRMDEAQVSSLPLCLDDLGISRSMVTTSLGGSFPFISNDLVDESGILYWVNLHSGSLVIFDRFSHRLPNANSIILATSGAGKSFTCKLEILRYLLLGIETIIIDPENEYKWLCENVWGSYITISANSPHHINPFDLPPKLQDIDYKPGDLLRSQVLNLIGLIDVLTWGLTAEEEAMLDTALQTTYALKEITFEDDSIDGRQPPLMEDLLHVLEGTEWGDHLAIRISKYVTGSFSQLFNNYTNVDLDTRLTVFSIRDIEDALKTPAMYNVLNYIWTKVRAYKTQRLLVIDEAWIMMQQKVAANFLYQITKRARKYGLGITTITQDVEDFLKSDYGKPIVSNASFQILLKQSTASIKALENVFGLSEAEKQHLVSANIWEWLLFAGNQHVAVKILASPKETDFITTDVTWSTVEE